MSRDTHYNCQVVHLTNKGEVSTRRHNSTCRVAEGHGGTTLKCPTCQKEYQKTYWTKPGRRDEIREKKGRKRNPSLPHYACSLSPEDHPIQRGVGRDHRAGCAVAEGHLLGTTSSSLCPACARSNNRKISRAVSLKSRHQMTIAEYDVLFERQKGRCVICKQTQKGLRLAVDHSHQTGERRGLLCRSCNLGLGNFHDDPSVLRSAIRYLGRSEEVIQP